MKGYYAKQNHSFEEWKQRGVYLAQCRTHAIAKRLGLSQPSVQRVDMSLPVLITYRVLPPYRDQYIKVARSMIALGMKMERLKQRLAA